MYIPKEEFESYITVRKNLGMESIRHSMSRFKIIQTWFEGKDLTKENIETFIYELINKGLKHNSLNTYHTTFCYIRDFCKDRGLPHEFYDGFKHFKKTRPNIIIFTEEEIDLLENTKLSYGKFRGHSVDFLDLRYRALTRFLAETGCRFGEAANLKFENLNLSAGKATFIDTKTNENRTVFVKGRTLLEQLIEITSGIKHDDLVFRNSVEGKIHPQDYTTDLKKRARKAGIVNLKKVHPHNFRHTYATMLLESGVPITEVSKLLGHKDIQTTYSTYMHLADRTLERAAMRLPLIRDSVPPIEMVKTIRETIDKFHLENDPRFIYTITETEGGILLNLQTK